MDHKGGPVIPPLDTQRVESYRHVFRDSKAATDDPVARNEAAYAPPFETYRESTSTAQSQGRDFPICQQRAVYEFSAIRAANGASAPGPSTGSAASAIYDF